MGNKQEIILSLVIPKLLLNYYIKTIIVFYAYVSAFIFVTISE